MNSRTFGRHRRAISPVLATVILIAITLIAAISIAGFVFGLFGTFTTTAQVGATSVACTHGAGGTANCAIILYNNGNSPAKTTGCSFTGSNGAGAGTLTGGGTIPAGSTLSITCTTGATAGATNPGTQATGSIGLSNGGDALFTGTFN